MSRDQAARQIKWLMVGVNTRTGRWSGLHSPLPQNARRNGVFRRLRPHLPVLAQKKPETDETDIGQSPGPYLIPISWLEPSVWGEKVKENVKCSWAPTGLILASNK